MADTRRNGSSGRDSESPAARTEAGTASPRDPNRAARYNGNGRGPRQLPSGRAAGAGRDALAAARDDLARGRDQAAERRDRELAARDDAWRGADRAATGAQILLRAAATRRHAAADRAAAALGRALAAADRERAAGDRAAAARDRVEVQFEIAALMRRVAAAETDALTGARTRRAGLADLDCEIDRARRTSAPLTVAYLDVVGLKTVNDTQGHAAGDALLHRVVHAVRAQLRSYDVVVRVGGDEFVCVLSGTTPADAAQRFDTVRAGLAAAPEPCEFKIGFAALRPGESGAELVGRADAELPAQRDR